MSSNPTPSDQVDHSYQSDITSRRETKVIDSTESFVDPELLLFDLETACTKQAVYDNPVKSYRLISIPKTCKSKDKNHSSFEITGQDDCNWNTGSQVKESEATHAKSRSASPDIGSPNLEDLEVLEQSYPDDVDNTGMPIPHRSTTFTSFPSVVDASYKIPPQKNTKQFGDDSGFHNWSTESKPTTNEVLAPIPHYPPSLGWESGLGLGLNVGDGFSMGREPLQSNFDVEGGKDGTDIQEIEDRILGGAARNYSLEEGEIYEPGYDAVQRDEFVEANLEEGREDYVEVELEREARICRTVYHETAGEWTLRYDPKLKKYRAKNPTPLRTSVSESD